MPASASSTADWVSPDAGWVPLGHWAREWLAAYVGRAASTQVGARSVLRAHVLPASPNDTSARSPALTWERMVTEIVAASLTDLRRDPDAFGRSPATLTPIVAMKEAP